MVEPNEIILAASTPALQERYSPYEILTAVDARSAKRLFEQYQINLVVLDLILRENPGSTASPKCGIELVQYFMLADSPPHIAVSSTYIKSLARIIGPIKSYKSGFAAGDKFTSIEEMLRLVDFAFGGSRYLPPQMRNCPEFKPHLLEMLRLKFEEGYSEKAIYEEICVKGKRGVSDRTLRNYWIEIANLLEVHPEPGKDIKLQILLAARRIGFID